MEGNLRKINVNPGQAPQIILFVILNTTNINLCYKKLFLKSIFEGIISGQFSKLSPLDLIFNYVTYLEYLLKWLFLCLR